MTDEKPKGGRPSKYEKIDLKQVEMAARKGWTDEEMCEFFGVVRSTWYEWKLKHKEFSDSLKEWKEEANSRVERSLYERAMGYSVPEDKIFNQNGEPLIVPTTKNYPPDTAAAIFWLKNRNPEKWKDKQDIDFNDKTPPSPEKRKSRINELLSKCKS